jgi:predicted SAM-dependent methyltransferase
MRRACFSMLVRTCFRVNLMKMERQQMNEEWSKLSSIFKKYNLGCGPKIYQNFLNVGYWNQLESGRIYKDLNGTDNTFMLNHDLRFGIPADDNTLDLVYHSHMLEHLTYQEGIVFIAECLRVLKPGGTMRILVPDLELWINAYTNNNTFFFNQYRNYGGIDKEIYVTKAAVFMGMLHNHEHRCGYDYESLKWLVEHVGFSDVNRTLYALGSVEDLDVIEPMDALKIMESLCIECKKPKV